MMKSLDFRDEVNPLIVPHMILPGCVFKLTHYMVFTLQLLFYPTGAPEVMTAQQRWQQCGLDELAGWGDHDMEDRSMTQVCGCIL